MIKVYSFKEDPPMFNLNLWAISIWLTKRNLIYIITLWLFPSFYLLIAFIWAWNLLVALIIELIAVIGWYILSILRIDNIPIDRYIINKITYKFKKEELEDINKKVVNFSEWTSFDDIVNDNIKRLLNDD